MISQHDVTEQIKAHALQLGFSTAGVCAAVTATGVPRLVDWLELGYAGEMAYLQKRLPAYEHPRGILEGARSVLMLTINYRTADPLPPRAGQGRVSRYAWGEDYHDLIRDKLNRLAKFVAALISGAEARGVVDSAPLLEREYAQLAGLGWVGKNTLLLSKDAGSYYFLAALVTTAELAADEPFTADHCGTCTACLDACPTDAFVAPYVLDARRCISYLTIEHRSAIAHELRSGMQDWLFGCDVCQEVCPWNHRAPLSPEPTFSPRGGNNPVELAELFDLDEAAFRQRFRHSPLWRAKRRGVLRNAAMVLGNGRHPASLPPLTKGLADIEPLVRGGCAWALGQIGGSEARHQLEARQALETDEQVLAEITSALAGDAVSG
jgi:epoxyqueuosine reductase